jgi:hypothetical protein
LPVPPATPYTIPVAEPTVATLVVPDDHVPPAVVSLNVVVVPAQIVVTPVMGATALLMVIALVAVTVLQLFDTEYIAVSAPAVTPVTTPAVLMVALPLVILHVPPLTVLDNVMVEATLTDEEPVSVPALGDALTVTLKVATALPHPLVTV